MTSTMTEAFDAPMTDSGDIDVSMYSGMATADSWLSVEEGIEIEMGDDDEPITEYEMADEGEVYDGSEIQDIEVYDISQVASPLPVDDNSFSAAHQSHVEDAEIMHIPSSDGPAEPRLPATIPVEVTVETEVITVVDSTFSGDQDSSTDVIGHDHVVPSPQNAASATAVQVSEGQAASDNSVPADIAVHVAETSELPASHPGSLEASTHQDAPEQEAFDHDSFPQHDPAALPELAQHDDHGQDPAVTEDRDPGPSVVDESSHGVAVDGNDPHEISDGVYIDPPPPVLLSLPPSADFGECCLFNLPTSSSPQSPSSSAQPDTGDGPQLLLQERPTLYYEPLSAVFTALRQEQCIHNMPGFAEAELVLDAYDLQLTISEDNVYTHEVTLHELNVIHDGSDLSGPLRLRLKVFSPRFATRYSMLRDQVSRLNLVEGGDVHPDTVSAQQYEHGEVQYDGQDHGEGAEQSARGEDESEVQPSAGGGGEGHGPEHAAESAAQDSKQEPVDAAALEETTEDADGVLPETSTIAAAKGGVVTGVDPATQAKQLAGAQERISGDEEEDVDAHGDYDEGPTFDADEVHEPSAEEAGDYLEHTVFPDDEDEFGEDLPEEVGGETRDEAYTHIGATDDQPERPQDANDFERGVDLGVVGEHEEQQYDDTGLHTNPYTDIDDEPNSNDASGTGVEDPLHPTSEEYTQDEVLNNLEAENVAHKESTALPTETEDGLDDNWDEADEADTLSSHEEANAEEHPDGLSRKSSTATLASGVSKRAYDEVDLDDFDDDDDALDVAASSPNAKRLRTQ